MQVVQYESIRSLSTTNQSTRRWMVVWVSLIIGPTEFFTTSIGGIEIQQRMVQKQQKVCSNT